MQRIVATATKFTQYPQSIHCSHLPLFPVIAGLFVPSKTPGWLEGGGGRKEVRQRWQANRHTFRMCSAWKKCSKHQMPTKRAGVGGCGIFNYRAGKSAKFQDHGRQKASTNREVHRHDYQHDCRTQFRKNNATSQNPSSKLAGARYSCRPCVVNRHSCNLLEC